jgi:methylase of polypeptide subunit release factors
MSQRESGYERKERDLYETPEWVTEALLPHLPTRPLEIWEPACGSGKMSRVLGRSPHKVIATDIHDPEGIAINFLDCPKPVAGPFDAIVTNPPYELATEFIDQALKLQRQTDGRFVAMLLRTDFDHAKTRSRLFAGCPAFAKKVVLTKRIKWFEDSKGQPSFNHAWFIWDYDHCGPPVLAYGPASRT